MQGQCTIGMAAADEPPSLTGVAVSHHIANTQHHVGAMTLYCNTNSPQGACW